MHQIVSSRSESPLAACWNEASCFEDL